MASRTFLPYANLVGSEYVIVVPYVLITNYRHMTKVLTPLMSYVTNEVKEDLKPNTPALVSHYFLKFFLLTLCIRWKPSSSFLPK